MYYTEDELEYYMQEAYNMGQEDLMDYIDEGYYDDGYDSAFDQVMQEGNIPRTELTNNNYADQQLAYWRKMKGPGSARKGLMRRTSVIKDSSLRKRLLSQAKSQHLNPYHQRGEYVKNRLEFLK